MHDPTARPADGVLEIKCPYSIDGVNVTDLSPTEFASRYPGKFCFSFADGEASLDRKHAYFAQVQGEMAVCNCSWCDFVVWTKGGLFVQRVMFDRDYWESAYLVLERCFRSVLLPELVLRRVQRGPRLDGSDIASEFLSVQKSTEEDLSSVWASP